MAKTKKTTKKKPKKTKEKKPKKSQAQGKKPEKTRTIGINLVSDTTKMSRVPEYLDFIQFMALPRVMREETMGIKTQQEFAKKYKLNEWTLVDWKSKPGFWDDVHNYRKQFFGGRAGDVWLALETTCIKEGKGQDVKVYFTLLDQYKEKTQEEHKVDPEVKKIIDKMGEFLDDNKPKNKGQKAK